jgi:hypothetical protein
LNPHIVVLQAGIFMMEEMGMGRMAILPYSHATGHWRCEFHPVCRPDRSFFKYTEGSGFSYLENHCGGTVSKNIKPNKLAEAILKSVPKDFLAQCEGDLDDQTKRWLNFLKDELNLERIPEAFNEYSSDKHYWRSFSLQGEWDTKGFPTPPNYVSPDEIESPWNADLELINGGIWEDLKDLPVLRFETSMVQRSKDLDLIGREYLNAIGSHVDEERLSLFRQAIQFTLADICGGVEAASKQKELQQVDVINVIISNSKQHQG